MKTDRLSRVVSGVKIMLPLALPIFVIATIYGSVAANVGIPRFFVVLFSLTIFSGAGQLLLVSLLSVGASAFVILFSIFCLNTRHFAFGIATYRDLESLRPLTRAFTVFGFTDEVFSCFITSKARKIRLDGTYVTSIWVCEYLLWALGSLLGTYLDVSWIPDIQQDASFLLALLFIAMVLPILKRRIDYITFFSGGLVAILGTIYLPQGLGIFCGIVFGTICGAICKHFSKELDVKH